MVDSFYERHLAPRVLEALADTPVVLIHGPRQAGKSTLARTLISDAFPATYRTFDDLTVLGAAKASPEDFLAQLEGPVILDEVQRVPELFLALKANVDRLREPGRYLLTGSVHAQFLPRLSEALAGRMEIQTLWPLSQGEIEGRRETFLDAVFGEEISRLSGVPLSRDDILSRAITGGFPDALQRRSPHRRSEWFAAYVTTVLQREVTDLAAIEGFSELPNLLSLIAARTGGIQNVSDLSRASGLPQTTLKRYLALLQAAFLVQRVPAWSANLGKRLIKSPKLYVTDSGLLAYLLGLENGARDVPGTQVGPLLEAFVGAELRKQLGWSKNRPSIHHYRSTRQEEIDFLLEDRRGRVVGIEVKASASVAKRDFRHLARLRDELGERFLAGVVLHTGGDTLPFGERLVAAPVSALWRA